VELPFLKMAPRRNWRGGQKHASLRSLDNNRPSKLAFSLDDLSSFVISARKLARQISPLFTYEEGERKSVGPLDVGVTRSPYPLAPRPADLAIQFARRDEKKSAIAPTHR